MKSKFYYLAAIVVASLSSCVDPNASSGKSGSGGAGAFGPLIFFPLIILVFWLFFIRPQAKKAKQTKDFHQKLQKGDKIVTIAGIHGVIYKINDD
ncbi:MAG TPA: preprotein translocase subunit YajC, partial [Chitinophagaceae bacterium]